MTMSTSIALTLNTRFGTVPQPPLPPCTTTPPGAGSACAGEVTSVPASAPTTSVRTQPIVVTGRTLDTTQVRQRSRDAVPPKMTVVTATPARASTRMAASICTACVRPYPNSPAGSPAAPWWWPPEADTAGASAVCPTAWTIASGTYSAVIAIAIAAARATGSHAEAEPACRPIRRPSTLTRPTASAATGNASRKSTARYGTCDDSEPAASKIATCGQATVPAAKTIARKRFDLYTVLVSPRVGPPTFPAGGPETGTVGDSRIAGLLVYSARSNCRR